MKLAILLLLIATSCSKKPSDPEESRTGTALFKIEIPSQLQSVIESIEAVVSASDMDTMRSYLAISGDSLAYGTISAIPVGKDRLFTLNAYKIDGIKSHTGSSNADVTPDTVQVEITLMPITGTVVITGLIPQTHYGDLILQGDEELLINNGLFLMYDGTINIRDNASLKIYNSTFRFHTEYHAERKWIISGNGKIEIVDSTIETPNKSGSISENEVVVEFQDDSEFLSTDSTIHGLELIALHRSHLLLDNVIHTDNIFPLAEWYIPQQGDTAFVDIRNSTLSILAVPFPKNCSATITGIQPLYIQSMHVYGSDLGYYLIVSNSSVGSLDCLIEEYANVTIDNSQISGSIVAKNTSSVSINNSSINEISLMLYDNYTSSCNIRNLHRGYYSSFDIGTACIGHNLSITLDNTHVTGGWSVIAHNVDLHVAQSYLANIRLWGSSVCQIDTSQIGAISVWGFDGSLQLDNAILDHITAFRECNMSVTGTAQVIDASDIIAEANGPCMDLNVHREYPVSTSAGATLELLDQGNNVIWTGTADLSGYADITLDFDCSNYLNTYELKVLNTSSSILFWMGSSTPLILN
ncbi:MAG: hypothetical protein RTU30_15530 [Candidatus Thorarchaeota archaeon]